MTRSKVDNVRAPRMTVADGDFNNKEEKIRFTKTMILGFLSKGLNKKMSATMAGISEVTFYEYVNTDPEFKTKVDACLGGEDIISAQVNISQAVRSGDIEASKYLLNKTMHYEKRYNPKFMDPNMIEVQKNPVTGVLDVYTDYKEISDSILGSEFESDKDSALDEMEQILLEQDSRAEEFIEELMDK